ncbi:MAG: deoxyguanosinetriphosphate triphosphohydrolase [Planctomycetota bacterium]|jgi:dGTPase|nr:deoxyguanosinetriphosphate triphosphohydrolase [Planctomycetota bacterium]
MSVSSGTIFDREALEERERRDLAAYATASADSRGRVYPEQEHPYRSVFQRDRDRIIHSTAFRRLEYKTQVFVNHEGDHYRTRLTHTIEVTQITRSISRALRANEDLAEVLALAHDLGHTPFGHSGEEALTDLMSDHGGFEHNEQALRVVDLLECPHPERPGLNLTHEVRESLVKHTSPHDHPDCGDFDPDVAPLFEAQICSIADSIAYDNHDIDDGIDAGLIQEIDLREIPIWNDAVQSVHQRRPGISGRMLVKCAVRHLINLQVTDLIQNTLGKLEELGIQTFEDFRSKGHDLVDFSPELKSRKTELEGFLMERVYKHYRVVRMERRAKRFLRQLFEEFVRDPRILPPKFQQWAQEQGLERAVCDYLAGMTDRFAQEEHGRLFHAFGRELSR